MNTPSQEFHRLWMGCLLGLLLGVIYGFLRPLRPKHTILADSLFLIFLIWAWLYQGFAVCRGDLRLGYYAGFPIGAVVWLNTLGRLLSPIFALFWKGVNGFFHGLSLPLKIIFQKIKKIFIFLLASAKKKGTIKSNNDDHIRKKTGGSGDGTKKTLFQPHSAEISSQLPSAQVRSAGSSGIVYDLLDGDPQRNTGK